MPIWLTAAEYPRILRSCQVWPLYPPRATAQAPEMLGKRDIFGKLGKLAMQSLWSDKISDTLEGLDLLVYATHLIGEHAELVLRGGGNSSMKAAAKDHLGQAIRALWIKGSGSDMKTITANKFTPLRLDELLPLFERGAMTDEEVVAYQSRCMLDPAAPRPSIETLLHAFLQAPHVYHTHADSICTLTDTSDSAKLVRRVYGDEVALIPYHRPGFILAKRVGEAYQRNPPLRAIILDKHGLITWGNTPKAAYLETIRMVSDAERFIRRGVRGGRDRPTRTAGASSVADRLSRAALLAPILRGAMSQNRRTLVLYEDSEPVLAFVNDPRARVLSQVGPFTPDHLLHTKPTPLFLELPDTRSPQMIARAVQRAVERHLREYVRYFEQYKSPGVTMLDPYPRVVLVPGLGMFASGKDRRTARITRDVYVHTMRVIRHASMMDSYTSLPSKEICDFEYWPLENFKLTLLPAEKLLSRRVALVTGAAGAIGRAIAARLVSEGASVILTDLDEEKVRALSADLNNPTGETNTVPVAMDVADEAGVSEAFQKAVLAYGGSISSFPTPASRAALRWMS